MDLLDPSKLSPGDVLADRYRVEELIGVGGFGAVYRATQLNLGRQVAIKVLHASQSSKIGRGRFWREAKLAQALEHPNTVRIFDFGETPADIPYIVFQFLRGRSLDTAIDQDGPMSLSRTARISTQVLKSLMEAHEMGIVHRDIKPDNVFLTDFQGEPDFVKILDFGVSKTVFDGAEQGTQLTLMGEMIGTPNYMAPEQVRAEPVGPQADVYALGLVMAEMLTGRQVFTGPSAISVCFEQSSAAPAPIPREVVESPLGPVVIKATRKVCSERFRDAAEMLGALEAVVGALATDGPRQPSAATRSAPLRMRQTIPSPTIPSVARSGGDMPEPRPNRVVVVVAIVAIVLLGIGMAAAGVAVGSRIFSVDDEPFEEEPLVTVTPMTTPPQEPTVMPGPHSTPNAPPQPPDQSNASSRLERLTPEVIDQRLTSWGWQVLHRSDIGPSGGMQAVLFTITNGAHTGGVWLYFFDDAAQAQMMTNTLGSGGRAAHGEGHRILLIELRRDHGAPIDNAACQQLLNALLQ
jgi:serine/threonine-protein kinase